MRAQRPVFRLQSAAWLLAAIALCAAATLLVSLPVAGALPAGGSRSGAADDDPESQFTKTEAMILMRDGVRLHTGIYVPKNASGALPFLLTRTPYGFLSKKGGNPYFAGAYRELAAEGFIFVFQDIRGRYQSEGHFIMLRTRDRSDPRSIDESTDTYDSIDWLLKNVPHNNGRVGVLGISYDGWLTVMATLDPHPALKAVSEQASPADMFLGDDFHHNGAFRLSYGWEYAALMETSRTNFNFRFGKKDTYDWYLSVGPLSNFNSKYAHGKLPSWNNFGDHPNYDEFWQRQAVPPRLGKPTVPNLNVAGWWDQEDFYGPVEIYEALEKNDPNHRNYLIAGPWNHGGWARGAGRKLGPVDFENETARYFREKIETPWFAYWLKDKGRLEQPEALTFQTGSNKWLPYSAWPPRENIRQRNLYLQPSGKLSFDEPLDEAGAAADSYISDPAHPVPYRHRPISPTYPGPGWPTWLIEDQRFVSARPDVLSWKTDVLDTPLAVTGDIVADLFASTTGGDADWIVKLIDVYPGEYSKDPAMAGYQLMIADEVFRARFRRGFSKPEPIRPGEIAEYKIDLHTNNHAFLPGHRIMVEVQSTWFPLIDRNPQTFVENIFKASAADYQKATQRIYRSKTFPSHVRLPVAAE